MMFFCLWMTDVSWFLLFWSFWLGPVPHKGLNWDLRLQQPTLLRNDLLSYEMNLWDITLSSWVKSSSLSEEESREVPVAMSEAQQMTVDFRVPAH